jgi:hypothetical protein
MPRDNFDVGAIGGTCDGVVGDSGSGGEWKRRWKSRSPGLRLAFISRGGGTLASVWECHGPAGPCFLLGSGCTLCLQIFSTKIICRAGAVANDPHGSAQCKPKSSPLYE